MVVLSATASASAVVRVPVTEEPLPPEFQFASDSLFPVMRDPARAHWVLERLTPIIAKFPNHAPFRQIKFWGLANTGAPVGLLTALTDSLIGGVFPTGRRDPPGWLQRAHHCLELAQVLFARREALPTAESYLQKAMRYKESTPPSLRTTCEDLLARIRRAQGKADSTSRVRH